MSKKESFDKLYSIHSAIEDIDRISSYNFKDNKTESKIDLVLNFIKDINKRELDESIVDKVVADIREGLQIMYMNELAKLNKDIKLDTKVSPQSNIVYRDRDMND